MEELMGKVEEIVPAMSGWCPLTKAKYLVGWILANKPKLVVEIGVFSGRCLIPMALAVQSNNTMNEGLDSMAIGIDPYTTEASLEGDLREEDVKWWHTVDLDYVKREAKEAIAKHGVEACCDVIEKTSQDAVSNFADESVGLLHIDGCHSEIASTRDVQLWFPKVAPGGLIVLDDVDWATVQAARRMLHEKAKITARAKTWEVFRKEAIGAGPAPIVV